MLKALHLVKDYRVGKETVHALRDVTVEVATGEFLVISGPSGSGKTTLLNLIAGIDRPTAGEVYLEGQPLSKLSDRQLAQLRREKIGLIFQTFNLIPVLSAYENVEYPLVLLGVRRSERRRRVTTLFEEVGLSAMAQRRPDELSGGQRQRVAIARALVTNPKVVLADEPTAHLDSEAGAQVMHIMRRLNEEHKVTFVVVTHDPVVARYASRLLHLRDGRVADGQGVQENA
jgi:putative ABC transport system ATP-binding protein